MIHRNVLNTILFTELLHLTTGSGVDPLTGAGVERVALGAHLNAEIFLS